MTTPRSSPATALASVGLLVLGLVAAVSLSSCGDAVSQRSPAGEGSALKQEVALFATPAEGLPQSVRRVLRDTKWKLDEDQAQELDVNVPGRVWAVPGGGTMCLVTQETRAIVGTLCDSIARVLRRGLSTTFLTDRDVSAVERRYIVGIAPKTAKAAIATTRGDSFRIPVVGGVFIHVDGRLVPPDQLSLVG